MNNVYHCPNQYCYIRSRSLNAMETLDFVQGHMWMSCDASPWIHYPKSSTCLQVLFRPFLGCGIQFLALFPWLLIFAIVAHLDCSTFALIHSDGFHWCLQSFGIFSLLLFQLHPGVVNWTIPRWPRWCISKNCQIDNVRRIKFIHQKSTPFSRQVWDFIDQSQVIWWF